MRQHLGIGVYFALGIFVVFESDSFFSMLQNQIALNSPEYMVYTVLSFFAAIGALLILAIRKLRTNIRNALVTSAYVMATSLPSISFLLAEPTVFWIALIIFNIIVGINASACAFFLYRMIKAEKYAVIMLSISTLFGVLLTYAVDLLFPEQTTLLIVLLGTAVIAMMYLGIRRIGLFELLDAKYDSDSFDGHSHKQPRFLTVLLSTCAAVAIMSYMIGINDTILFSTLIEQSATTVYTPQMLLYLPGLLIAGVLANYKGGRYFPITTLAVTLLVAPAAMQLSSTEAFLQFSGAMYFLGAFFLIYIMTSLVTLAKTSPRPEIIASLPAFIFFFMSAIGSMSSGLLADVDSLILLMVYIALAAIMLIIFYFSGNLQQTPIEPRPTPSPALEELAKETGFTNRETEVLRYLLDGYQTSQIAAKMVVTENTVYKYVSSMITKTGVRSRSALVSKFSHTKRYD